MAAARRTIVLFDLDGTLLAVPADRELVTRALHSATGVADLAERMRWSGRTDRWIAEEAARLAELANDGIFERYTGAYSDALRETLAGMPDACALPGARALLEALAARDDTVLGVSTGNLRRNAEAKLAHAGLARYLEPLRGAFGDTHLDRNDVVAEAARECGYRPGDRLVVVGDTEFDVRAGLAADALAIGVTTGSRTAEELRAAGAWVVLPDLVDIRSALRAILGEG